MLCEKVPVINWNRARHGARSDDPRVVCAFILRGLKKEPVEVEGYFYEDRMYEVVAVLEGSSWSEDFEIQGRQTGTVLCSDGEIRTCLGVYDDGFTCVYDINIPVTEEVHHLDNPLEERAHQLAEQLGYC